LGTVTTFDHTADLGLAIRAADLDDLFRTAAIGLFDCIVANREAVRVECNEAFHLMADSPPELLQAWLGELIFRSEVDHCLYSRFEVHVAADGLSLAAEIGGERIDPKRHLLDLEVKAVTHHGLVLRQEGTEWVAEVILDI
jgi:SHS2 domain-containing protein